MTQQLDQQMSDDREPIFSIAVKPRETIRYVLQHKGLRYFLFIGALGAFSSNLASFISTKYDPRYSLGEIVYASFVSGLLLFVITTVLISLLLQTIGKAFGGESKFKELFGAMCMTTVPYIWILPGLLFWMQLSPQSYFKMPKVELTMGDTLLLFVGIVFVAIMAMWTFIITLVGISEVHKFSKWKAFLVFLIAVFALAIILGIVSVVFGIQLI